MLKSIAAALLLFFAAGPLSAHPEPLPDHLWAAACSYMTENHGTTCEGVAPPVILFAEFRDFGGTPTPGFVGQFWPGSDYILVGVHVSPIMQYAAMFHESIHYILDRNPEAGDAVGFCGGEAVARIATAKYLEISYDDTWRSGYGCELEG